MKTAPDDGTEILVRSGEDYSVVRFEGGANGGWVAYADGQNIWDINGDRVRVEPKMWWALDA